MLIRALWLIVLLVGFTNGAISAEKIPLQPIIDQAKAGDVVQLDAGLYQGPVTIEIPITLDGQNHATVDAGGKGSVIYLDTDGATIKNLRLTNSGDQHNDIDSGVQVRGNFNVIKDNVIDNCLFGVDLQQSENNIVRRNSISSKPFHLGLRGDAVRLWYSFNNTIAGNTIKDSRDMVVWYSKDNIIKDNVTSNGRYGLHFMYSQYNKVTNNRYINNSVGIFLMYSDGVVLKNNYIAHATGASGVGIGFKETSDIVVENNQILFSSTGFYIDVSPYQPDTINVYENNLVAFNGIGIRFLADWQGSVFKHNQFKSNITQILVSGGKTANRNTWENNFWDDYEGFDRDGDGFGDTPYEYYAYADRIWQDVPNAQFFKGSPILETIDFLERLAPFSPPDLIIRDKKPVLNAESALKKIEPASSPAINKYFQ